MPVESLKLTTPEEATQFVAETKVDVLAPAVGNMHGLLPAKVRGEAHKRINIERIRQIKRAAGSVGASSRQKLIRSVIPPGTRFGEKRGVTPHHFLDEDTLICISLMARRSC